eukprot:6739640-Pyramimonas_sp.AAC.1
MRDRFVGTLVSRRPGVLLGAPWKVGGEKLSTSMHIRVVFLASGRLLASWYVPTQACTGRAAAWTASRSS